MKLIRCIAAFLVVSVGDAHGAVPIHQVGSLPVQVLQEQTVASKDGKESLEHDKQTLSESMDKMQRTRSSVETKCVRERAVLREKFRQTEERAGNTATIAEQLQAQNMKLRGDAFEAQRRFDESQHEIAVNMFELEHLKDSVREVLKRDWPLWAPPTNQTIPKMVDFLVSSLMVENTELHAMVSNLKANLSETQHDLHAKAADADHHARVRIENSKLHAKVSNLKADLNTAQHQLQEKRLRSLEKAAEADRLTQAKADAARAAPPEVATDEDGSDTMADALDEQNMALLRQLVSDESTVRDLLSQVSGLKDDKAHLIGPLQSAMSEEMHLRLELDQMRKDKDEEIQKLKDEIARHAEALSTKSSASVTAAQPPAQLPAQPPTQPLGPPMPQPPSQLSPNQALEGLVSPSAFKPAMATVPIVEIVDKAAEKPSEVEEMKKLAVAASAASSEPLGAPLSAWDVLPEVPHEISKLTEPTRVVSWLGKKSSSRVGSWSPVGDLDSQASVAAQKAQMFDENRDAESGKSVAQFLRRAQSVVSDVGGAA